MQRSLTDHLKNMGLYFPSSIKSAINQTSLPDSSTGDKQHEPNGSTNYFQFTRPSGNNSPPDTLAEYFLNLSRLGYSERVEQATLTNINPKLIQTYFTNIDLIRNPQERAIETSRAEELKYLLKYLGLKDDDLNLLNPLLNNQDFQNLLFTNPNLAQEMLETIKSDPFSQSNNNTNFNKDHYEIFSKLERTNIDSILRAGLGEKNFETLNSIGEQYPELYKKVKNESLSSKDIKAVLEDNRLNSREKLKGLIENVSKFVLDKMSETNTGNSLSDLTVKELDIESRDDDNEKLADIYAKVILHQINSGEDISINDSANMVSGSLASLATQTEIIFTNAQKSRLKINSNDFNQVFGKFSGLSTDMIDELLKNLEKNYTTRELGVLLQAGKTNVNQLSDNDLFVMSLFNKYQKIDGKNNKNLYEADMKDLHEKGVLVNYLYDTMPGSNMTYKQAAESIMNIPADSRGFFDGATGLNAIASVNTIAQILKDPENAFMNSEGFYARLTIADKKDHNGAFGLNTGNHYVRGNEEAAMTLLSNGKLGNITIYGGNGMTDNEFELRLRRLIMTGTQLDGNRGQLNAITTNSNVRGLGLKHVSEEGHGNQRGNHGVVGSLDSGDHRRFKTYADLVKGDIFTLNCVACSNMGGNHSYGHTVLNEMAKHLPQNVRLYATGAEIPTPPKNDRLAHFKGHLAPGLMTNSDRLIAMQGQLAVNETDISQLSIAYRDKYNITRTFDDNFGTTEQADSKNNDNNIEFRISYDNIVDDDWTKTTNAKS